MDVNWRVKLEQNWRWSGGFWVIDLTWNSPALSFSSRSFNELGTVRTLRSLVAAHKSRARLGHKIPAPTKPSPEILPSDGVVRVSNDAFLRRPAKSGDKPSSTRLRADVFTVTPGGGLFRSSSDRNVSIYFPINAVPCPVSITMQVKNTLYCSNWRSQSIL